jgi:hypothetical protein
MDLSSFALWLLGSLLPSGDGEASSAIGDVAMGIIAAGGGRCVNASSESSDAASVFNDTVACRGV